MRELKVGDTVIETRSGRTGTVFEEAPLGVYVQFEDDQDFFPHPYEDLSLPPGEESLRNTFTPRRTSRPWSSTQRRPSVPSLFRQMPINSNKQREPTRNEVPAQQHDRRSRDQHQKFELYYDIFTSALEAISGQGSL